MLTYRTRTEYGAYGAQSIYLTLCESRQGIGRIYCIGKWIRTEHDVGKVPRHALDRKPCVRVLRCGRTGGCPAFPCRVGRGFVVDAMCMSCDSIDWLKSEICRDEKVSLLVTRFWVRQGKYEEQGIGTRGQPSSSLSPLPTEVIRTSTLSCGSQGSTRNPWLAVKYLLAQRSLSISRSEPPLNKVS